MEKCSKCNNESKKLRLMQDGRRLCHKCYFEEKQGKKYVRLSVKGKDKPISEPNIPNTDLSTLDEIKYLNQIKILKDTNVKIINQYANLKTEFDMLSNKHENLKREFNSVIEILKETDKVMLLTDNLKKIMDLHKERAAIKHYKELIKSVKKTKKLVKEKEEMATN